MKPRTQGERFRPIVTVLVAIDGMPVKIKVSGKTYVLKAFKQRKGRWGRKEAKQNEQTSN
ncbi:hypothetical protein PACILC2_21800 [Paenibacillus cisolokensis]|uniref:Transposase n=1 Tax=Paenibacillus cisolokensis TaxID=1658519 RepID=A0ABQ4N635_9BACL|nr:hypothetical protein [Paenibacillus cisolokensis]GIQ63612.1 hypothetical protein PACILC2_21800 [Paenibacillus cisolokensis]